MLDEGHIYEPECHNPGYRFFSSNFGLKLFAIERERKIYCPLNSPAGGPPLKGVTLGDSLSVPNIYIK